jgi:hypothetical protein
LVKPIYKKGIGGERIKGSVEGMSGFQVFCPLRLHSAAGQSPFIFFIEGFSFFIRHKKREAVAILAYASLL